MAIKNLLTPMYLDQWRDCYDDLEMENLTINRVAHAAGPDVQHRVLPTYQYLARFVTTAVQDGELPVTWNGDCCAAIPMLAGLQGAGVEPALIWLDAHGDFNTWDTSPSGFIGGMPLAMMVGRGEQTLVKGVGQTLLDEEDIILTDARELDSQEAEMIKQSAILHLHRTNQLTSEVELPDKPIWVHFDVDVLRIEDSPATNFPTRGGPTIPELQRVFAKIRNTGRLCGVSVSLWDAELPGAKKSESAVRALVKDLTGSW